MEKDSPKDHCEHPKNNSPNKQQEIACRELHTNFLNVYIYIYDSLLKRFTQHTEPS